MARFAERVEAIRAAAEAAAPEDCWVRLSDNLSHLGNGTFAVSFMRERETPVPVEEPGDNPYDEYVGGATIGPFDDLATIDWR